MAKCRNCGETDLLRSDLTPFGCVYCTGRNNMIEDTCPDCGRSGVTHISNKGTKCTCICGCKYIIGE